MIKFINANLSRRFWGFGFVSTGLILSSCGGSSNSSPPPVMVVPPPSNSAPVFSGETSFSGDENTEISITLTATDADGDTLTYSMDGSGDANHFTLNSDGTLTGVESFDFESPSDENDDNVYEFPITVSDGEDEVSGTITVTINGVNEAPVYTGPGNLFASEWALFSDTLSASDPEDDAVSFALGDTPDAALFSLDASGTLSAVDLLDFETPRDNDANNVYNLSLEMSDGELTSSTDLLVTLGDSVESDMTFKAFGLGGSILRDYTVALYNLDGTLFGEFEAADVLTLDLPLGEYRAEFTKYGYEPHDQMSCTAMAGTDTDCEVELLLADDVLLANEKIKLVPAPDNTAHLKDASISSNGVFVSYNSFNFREFYIGNSELGEYSEYDPGRFAVKSFLSGDGRYIAFESGETNLVDGDNNNVDDIYVAEIATQQVIRVSIGNNGIEGASRSENPAISHAGRYVVFDTRNRLSDEDTNNAIDIYRYDRETAQVDLISVATDGSQGNGNSKEPSISADGNVITFLSLATNFAPNDTNDTWDVFVHDKTTNETERVSEAPNGEGANGQSDSTIVSGNGQFVLFKTYATNLLDEFRFGTKILVFDRDSGEFDFMATRGDEHAISADGRFVAYTITGRPVSGADVIVIDRTTGNGSTVSVPANGLPRSEKPATNPSISADGRMIAFESVTKFDPDEQSVRGSKIYVATRNPIEPTE